MAGIRLLQVFGDFSNQEKLMSFDLGILGDINVNSTNMSVSCDKVSSDKLDSILDELEVIEPAFNTIRAELTTIIQEKIAKSKSDKSKMTQDSSDRESEIIASAMATLLNLRQSIFNQHSIEVPKEDDYQKAGRLLEDGQYELALEHISKFKREIMDDNPYPYGSEKGMSVSVSANAYKIMANCYRSLHKYTEALNTLVEMQNMLHNVLSDYTLQSISETYAQWKKEAEEYEAPQTQKERSILM